MDRDPFNPGQVYVYLGGSSTPSHEFTDPDGFDVIQASGSGVTCQVLVPAIDAPTGGIQFNSGSNSTLEVDPGLTDTDIEVGGGATSSAVEYRDPVGEGDSLVIGGAGVSTLYVRPNDAGGATVNASSFSAAIHLIVNTGAGTDDTVNLGDDAEGSTVVGADVITGAGGDVVNVEGDGDDSQTTATVDFGDGTGSGDNTLNVLTYCVATIAQLAGASHTVVLDNLNISGGGTVVVADAAAIGSIQVDQNGALLVEAASSVGTMNTDAGGVEVAGGVAEVEAPTTIDSLTGAGFVEFTGASAPSAITTADQTGNVIVDYGAVVTVGGDGAAASTFNVLANAGTTYLASPVTVADLEESNGLVQLDRSGTWKTSPLANEIDTIDITAGRLDLDGQDVLTDTGVATIRGYVAGMYDGGAWDGSTGIYSSYAPNSSSTYAVGFATSDDNATTGLSLSSGQVLLRPTVAGDVTLDGHTNIADLSAWNDNFGTGDEWAQGDLNYSGTVNIADESIWNNDFGDAF